VLVGGTGLYLRTLLDGIAPVPEIDPDIRHAVRAFSVAEAHERLAAVDAEAAARLNPNDTTRIARALEVALSTGKTLSDWQTVCEGGLAPSVELSAMLLLPPRDWLRARCDARFETMLEGGAFDEVAALLARRLDANLPVMRAIGVREIAAMITDPSCRDTKAEEAKAATRQFAKRQYTWFRNQSPPDWAQIDAKLDDSAINELAIKLHDIALTR
jgi:tRNA dimethylallyltransferase